MSDDPTLDMCTCGHIRYHHRPECGYQNGTQTGYQGQLVVTETCHCPRFRKSGGDDA